MSVKIGNNYLVWVAAPGGSPTYARFGGQQGGKLGASRQTADASHKTSGGVALKIPGLLDVPIDMTFVCDLPDVNGYSLVEAAFNAGTAVLVQVRKGGIAGISTDAVFACSMYITSFSVDFALNGSVSGSAKFEAESAPTTLLTMA